MENGDFQFMKETLKKVVEAEKGVKELLEMQRERDIRHNIGNYPHSFRTAFYAATIYEPPKGRTLVPVVQSALLHDIGKTGISPDLEKKPGEFTPEERLEMNRHKKIGQRIILERYPDIDPLIPMVARYHSVRFDPNTCYPEASRIIKIVSACDCWDAMVSKRHYKEEQFAPAVYRELLQIALDASDIEQMCIAETLHTRYQRARNFIVERGIYHPENLTTPPWFAKRNIGENSPR